MERWRACDHTAGRHGGTEAKIKQTIRVSKTESQVIFSGRAERQNYMDPTNDNWQNQVVGTTRQQPQQRSPDLPFWQPTLLAHSEESESFPSHPYDRISLASPESEPRPLPSKACLKHIPLVKAIFLVFIINVWMKLYFTI
ncbi:hypothetical protein ATANTOWER_009519 [Ataeniobius toweri]|uniref:Uncharacterized protein n=1 Tax=Ataeniobius toweri TaxID=208326 RepID=A0ABU7BLP0_9TELE|nr:hypothetical protein [Ataeniobius toweri]